MHVLLLGCWLRLVLNLGLCLLLWRVTVLLVALHSSFDGVGHASHEKVGVGTCIVATLGVGTIGRTTHVDDTQTHTLVRAVRMQVYGLL